ncbi:MAG: phage tail tube protein, partial [Candidatus Methanomethylicaceae archaeon]
GSSDVITISGKDGANTKTFTITGNGSGSTGSTKFTEISSISLSSGTNFGSLKIGVLEGTSGSTTATTQEISFKKTDYYDIPYYTFRFYPGNKWREVYQDIRVAGLSFEFTPPQFMRATLSLMGRVPSTGTSTLSSVTVDNSSLYVSNAGFAIINGELLRVLSGNVVIQNNIKIDEEYVLGSIYPESLSIVSRMITFNFIAKIQSGSSLYRLMMYDPSGGNSWTLAPFETNDFMMMLGSITTGASSAFTTKPPSYSPLRNYMLFLTDSNVAKLQAMVAPLAIRPQGSLVMQIALNVIQKSVNSNYSPIVVKYINYG